jgi:heat shock protein HtpX
MSEAYGLYSHIRTNQYRSAILIAGLFVLVYLLVFAFTLAFNGFAIGDEPFGYILDETLSQFVWLVPFATLATALWVFVGFAFTRG